ncbi:hypothetical protein [uncultured Cetobacterium sp.]|uniref:hypothetical protein n=1 Tax=uncultured Cetobacterium sp. TaxID=527638 RepID=UPI002610157D|nr:hypothetical protein [uncultured Cetobacterium sp.]
MEKEYLKKVSKTKDQTYTKGGVDTIGILFNTDIEIADIKGLNGILDKYTTITGKNEIVIVIKPSQSINGGVELTTVKETLAFIEEIKIQLGLSNGTLKRIDFSVDLKEDFESNKKLFRLLLECLNLKRSSGGMYETKKPVLENRNTGNFKIMSKRSQTTIYNSSDKNRLSETRYENRILDMRNAEEIKKRMLYELKKHIKELEKLEELVPLVESCYTNYLLNEYNKGIDKNFRTFTEFIAWADYEGLILTENILKGLMKESGINLRFKHFVYNFKRLRVNTLVFSNKTEIKKLLIKLKKALKELSKST